MSGMIGIIVPFFNNLNFLDELLASLVAQVNPNWEALVIDDSPGKLISDDYQHRWRDLRISFLGNETNEGAVATWNRGLRIMTSREIGCGRARR
jgi:glycosyltransferase involved in cell wall biosynthesis